MGRLFGSWPSHILRPSNKLNASPILPLRVADMYESMKLVDAAGDSLQLVMYVFAVVRDSRMWCPHDIGRDSWVWGEQESLWIKNSPHEEGEELFTERGSSSGGNGVALG